MSEITLEKVMKETSFDEYESKAVLDVFKLHYEDKFFDDFISLVKVISEDEYCYTIFEDFVERNCIDEHIASYLDEDSIVRDYGIYWSSESVLLDDGSYRLVVWESF